MFKIKTSKKEHHELNLEDLERIAPELIRDEKQRNQKLSYPLLHQLIIKWRNEKEKKVLWPRYKALFQNLLNHDDTDVNITNRHGDTPLMMIVSDINDSIELVDLFLANQNVNVNYINSVDHDTVLEKAISRHPENHALIKLLVDRITITPLIQENLKAIFKTAIEESWASTINVILDFKLLPIPEDLDSSLASEFFPTEFAAHEQGLWIRLVEDIEQEVENLNRRSHLSPDELKKQRHTVQSESPYYTTYSPATFVYPGIPIHPFAFGSASLIIQTNPADKIHYWYDGQAGEELTREMDFAEGAKLDNKRPGQLWDVTLYDIATHMRRLYEAECEKIRNTRKSEPDKYGILARAPITGLGFRWNEGLFRYHKEQIIGFHVDPRHRKEVVKALTLKHKLQSEAEIYYYNDVDGSMKRLDRQVLIEQYSIKEEEYKGTSLMASSSTFFSDQLSQGPESKRPRL